MTPIKRYLADNQLLGDVEEARRISKNSSRYTLINGNLFRYTFLLVSRSGMFERADKTKRGVNWFLNNKLIL